MGIENGNGLVVDISVNHDAEFIDRNALESAIRLIANDYQIEGGNISVGIVDDDNMHRLNLQFLQHDYTTDVLSFVYNESDSEIEGELILCADYARREAPEHNWLPESELVLYAVHGMLHLMGLDDTDDESRQAMRAEERDVLLRLGVLGAEGHCANS